MRRRRGWLVAITEIRKKPDCSQRSQQQQQRERQLPWSYYHVALLWYIDPHTIISDGIAPGIRVVKRYTAYLSRKPINQQDDRQCCRLPVVEMPVCDTITRNPFASEP
jgi:hypothetical protein